MFECLMWKMTGKPDKGGEQRSENNNRNMRV